MLEISKTLLGAVKDSEIGAAQRALSGGANPNDLNETEVINALQCAILQGNLEMVSLLLNYDPEVKKNKADINLVGHEFVSSIQIASKIEGNANKKELMERVILSRKCFSNDIFENYLATCLLW